MKLLSGKAVFDSASLADTESCAKELAQELTNMNRVILLFDGEMGAGKTQFCRYLMEALEVDETEVTSPSFSIHNSYESSIGSIEHLDLYRLTSEDDLESTGFWDLFLERPPLVAIEWGVRLKEMNLLSALPKTWPTFQIEFLIKGSSSRQISFTRL